MAEKRTKVEPTKTRAGASVLTGFAMGTTAIPLLHRADRRSAPRPTAADRHHASVLFGTFYLGLIAGGVVGGLVAGTGLGVAIGVLIGGFATMLVALLLLLVVSLVRRPR